MRNLILTDAVIGPERDVILEERRSRIENSPDALLSEEVDATLYQNHPYRIPVIGWMHEMEKLNRTDAVAFYDRYYAPNNAVLVVAGDVDADDGPAAGREDLRQGAARPGPAAARPPAASRSRTPERTVTLTRSRASACRASRSPGWCRPTTPPSPARPRRSTCCPRSSAAARAAASTRSWSSRRASPPAPAPTIQGTTLDRHQLHRSTARRAARPGSTQVEDGDRRRDRQDRQGRRHRQRTRKGQEPLSCARMIFARDNQSGMANIYGATLATGGTVQDIAAWPDRIRAVTADQVQGGRREISQPGPFGRRLSAAADAGAELRRDDQHDA